MYFAEKYKRRNVGTFCLYGTALDIVDNEKYLGHYISSDLSDTVDIKNQMKMFYVRANMILRKFSRCSDAVKLTLVRSYCCTVYCCSLWYSIYVYDYSRLNIAFNCMIRKIFKLRFDDSISNFCIRNKIKTLSEIRRFAINSLVTRLKQSNNRLIVMLYGLRRTATPFWNNVRSLVY